MFALSWSSLRAEKNLESGETSTTGVGFNKFYIQQSHLRDMEYHLWTSTFLFFVLLMIFSPFFIIGTPLTCSIMKDLTSLFGLTYKQPYKPISSHYIDYIFAGLSWLVLMEVFEAGANRITLDPLGNVGARLRRRSRDEKHFTVQVEDGEWGRGTFKGAVIQALTLLSAAILSNMPAVVLKGYPTPLKLLAWTFTTAKGFHILYSAYKAVQKHEKSESNLPGSPDQDEKFIGKVVDIPSLCVADHESWVLVDDV